MALTEQQIERVREIIGYQSYDAAETLVANLSAVQETETINDIDEWDPLRSDFTKIKNGLLGSNIDPDDQRLAIINRVRRRLGLSAVSSIDELANPAEVVYSHPETESNCGIC